VRLRNQVLRSMQILYMVQLVRLGEQRSGQSRSRGAEAMLNQPGRFYSKSFCA
jgi:hypothetical protein